jgi:hypothetical protein
VREPVAGERQKLAVVRQSHEDLGDRQRDELGVGDPRRPAGASAVGEEVVDQHVSCREKVVELGVHRGLRVDVAIATPDFGGLRAASSQPAGNLESIS